MTPDVRSTSTVLPSKPRIKRERFPPGSHDGASPEALIVFGSCPRRSVNGDRAVAASGDRRRRHDRDRTRVDRIEEPVRIRADTYPYGAERTCVDHTGFVQRDRIPDQLERDGIQTRIAAAVAQGAAVRSSDEAYEIERVGDPTVIEKGTPRLSCHGDSRRYARS